jgi:hypothetical protein
MLTQHRHNQSGFTAIDTISAPYEINLGTLQMIRTSLAHRKPSIVVPSFTNDSYMYEYISLSPANPHLSFPSVATRPKGLSRPLSTALPPTLPTTSLDRLRPAPTACTFETRVHVAISLLSVFAVGLRVARARKNCTRQQVSHRSTVFLTTTTSLSI